MDYGLFAGLIGSSNILAVNNLVQVLAQALNVIGATLQVNIGMVTSGRSRNGN